MFQPQPTTTLMLGLHHQVRTQDPTSPGLLLGLLVSLRELRYPPAMDSGSAVNPGNSESVSLPPHGRARSRRVRTGLGGRIEQSRRRRSARALRRGDLHVDDRRADRRGL